MVPELAGVISPSWEEQNAIYKCDKLETNLQQYASHIGLLITSATMPKYSSLQFSGVTKHSRVLCTCDVTSFALRCNVSMSMRLLTWDDLLNIVMCTNPIWLPGETALDCRAASITSVGAAVAWLQLELEVTICVNLRFSELCRTFLYLNPREYELVEWSLRRMTFTCDPDLS